MDGLLELFCDVDDFCQAFLPVWNRHQMANGQKQRQRVRSLTMTPPRWTYASINASILTKYLPAWQHVQDLHRLVFWFQTAPGGQ